MSVLLLAWLFPVFTAMLGPEAQAQRLDVIPPSGQWVTDLGGMFSPVEEQTLTQTLRFYADSTSTQIVIVTLPDLGGADIATYATELGQQWGVGQQGQDNGVVILVSRDDRAVFIATGYGLEGAIPDAIAGRIVREIVLPDFKQGRFYAGLAGAAAEAAAEAPTPEAAATAETTNTAPDDKGQPAMSPIAPSAPPATAASKRGNDEKHNHHHHVE